MHRAMQQRATAAGDVTLRAGQPLVDPNRVGCHRHELHLLVFFFFFGICICYTQHVCKYKDTCRQLCDLVGLSVLIKYKYVC